MARGAHIKRNSFFAFLSQLIRLTTNVLLFIGIARLYGVEAFGQFTTAHTMSTIFLLFADFGFDMLLPTEIARDRQRVAVFARRYFSLKLVFAGAATLVMATLPLWGQLTPSTGRLVAIFSLYVLFSSLNNFFFALFKGFEEFQHETRISFWTNIALIVLLVVMGSLRAPLYAIAVCFVCTRIVGVLACVRVSTRLVSEKVVRFDFTALRETWRYVLIFGLNFIFGNLFFQIDTLLLAFWRGDRDVGIYQAVFKVVYLALLLPDIAVTTVVPVLARLNTNDQERWQYLGRLLNKVLTLAALPVCIVLCVYGDQVIHLLYGGDGFEEAVPILRIFSFTIFVRYLVDAYAIMLTTSHRQVTRMVIVIGGTILSVTLNAFIIPSYGPIGAAIVAAVVNVAVGVAFIAASRQPFLSWTCDLRNTALFALTAAIGLVLLELRTLSMWLAVPPMLAIYLLAYYYVGFSREQWGLVLGRDQGAGTQG